MAFRESCTNIVLQGTTLYADCLTPDRRWNRSKLNLDSILGNSWGNFEWRGKNFGASSKDIRLQGTVLHAQLRNGCGDWCLTSVDLNERIANKKGSLSYFDRWRGMYSELSQDGGVVSTSFLEPQALGEAARRELEAQEAHEMEVRRTESGLILGQVGAYEYLRLPKATSIRLLRIENCYSPNDIIRCSLTVADLKDGPKYDALSYTWGNPFLSTKPELESHYRMTVAISCNGRRLLVKQNLYDALRRLRRTRIVEARDELSHKSPLMLAAEAGHIRRVQALLRQGANVVTQDKFGGTALHHAAENGHIDVVKALVLAGSSLTALDGAGRTPLDCAKRRLRGFWTEVVQFLEECAKWKVPAGRRTSLRTTVTNQAYIWVDAICINQSDDLEKAEQVALMGDIYKSAQSVVIWLGREHQDYRDTTAEDLFEAAWRLELASGNGRLDDETIDVLFNDPDGHTLESAPPALKLAAEDWLRTMDSGHSQRWLLWLPFFQRTWFQRAWVIQEMVVAAHLTVVCGQFVLPWNTFVLLSCIVDRWRRAIRHGHNPEGKGGQGFGIIVYRGAFILSKADLQDEVPPITLERKKRGFRRTGRVPHVSALTLSRNFRTTDPRDKVFAVLSFSSPMKHTAKTGVEIIRPDYVQSPKDLYLMVGKSLFQTIGPSILSFVGNAADSSAAGLPSWIPDLNSPMHCRPLDFNMSLLTRDALKRGASTRYDVTGNLLQSQSVYITDEQYLALRGYKWDVVADVAQPGLNSILAGASGLACWGRLLSKLNGTPQEKLECLWRTIIADEALGRHPAPDLKNEFSEWLKFVSFIGMIGCESQMSEKIAELPKAELAVYPQRSQADMLAVLDAIQRGFASLGIPLTSEETQTWRDYNFLCEQNIDWASWYFRLVGGAQKFGDVIRKKDMSRRLFRTEKNFLGTGVEQTQVGDLINIIPGTSVPYLLRSAGQGHFRLVGEAYVHGIMHGEAVRGADIRMEGLYIV
ncbi:MAG: hypothetical protein M1839_007405 [Geoglossum umbratile]|nr:MAG: hypothetical protein M1839_007405 [Geoglossum umbratile]